MNDWTAEQKELRKNLEQYFERLSDGHVDDDVAGVFPREKWDLVLEAGLSKLPIEEEWGGHAQQVQTRSAWPRRS